MPHAKSGVQAGMTLVECLASMAISVVLLAGLTGVLNLGLAGYRENKQFSEHVGDINSIIQRLTWAIETAERKKRSELIDKTGREHTSETWFDRKDSTGKTIVLRYDWNSANKTLNEYDDQNIARALLTDVDSFSVTSPSTTDTQVALILVTMRVQRNGIPITFNLSRPLGNIW